MSNKLRAAIIGPGNIGTDLLMKAMRSDWIEPVWMVGIEESEGIKRARDFGMKVSTEGVDGMVPFMKEDNIQIVFDATSAYVHAENSRKVNEQGAIMIDLTPAAIGPFCIPPKKQTKRHKSGKKIGEKPKMPTEYEIDQVLAK